MPLLNGYSKEAVSKSSAIEMKAGNPQKQSVAIALIKAKEAEKKEKK